MSLLDLFVEVRSHVPPSLFLRRFGLTITSNLSREVRPPPRKTTTHHLNADRTIKMTSKHDWSINAHCLFCTSDSARVGLAGKRSVAVNMSKAGYTRTSY